MADYTKIVEENILELRDELIKEISRPDLRWKRLIELLIEEDSPLAEILRPRTVQLADVCNISMALRDSASSLEALTEEIEESDGDSEHV